MPINTTLPEHEHIVLCLLKDQSRSKESTLLSVSCGLVYFNRALISYTLCSIQPGQIRVFKYQKDLYFFPENQRLKKIIEYACPPLSAKFGTCTVVVEAKMCTFTLESTHFIFNRCPVYSNLALTHTKRITVYCKIVFILQKTYNFSDQNYLQNIFLWLKGLEQWRFLTKKITRNAH